MIKFEKISHADYGDILDICKDIWGGTDYLPHIFHKWVDDKGFFLGAYTSFGKLVGCAKLSFLSDGTGWLEGLRVHKDYRNLGIGKELAKRILEIAKENLKENKINKIAFATHSSNVESISINTKLGFKKVYESIILSKNEEYKPKRKKEDFNVKHIEVDYLDFLDSDYLKKRNYLVPLSFKFEKATEDLIKTMNSNKQFISINGFQGMYDIKGEISFECFDPDPIALDTFYEYFSILSIEKGLPLPYTSICKEDLHLKSELVELFFETWNNWQPDYFYFVLDNKN